MSWQRSLILLIVLMGGVRLALLLVNSVLNSEPGVAVDYVAIPGEFPADSPFFAVVGFSEAPAVDTWLQLRICSTVNRCVHGARRQMAPDTRTGLVRATRELEAGDYTVSVLVQTRNRLGAIRTVMQADELVRYGS